MTTKRHILDEVQDHILAGSQHYEKAKSLLAMLYSQFPELGADTDTKSLAAHTDGYPPSLFAWAEWLGKNGPSLRNAVYKGTMKQLSSPASKRVLAWTKSMDTWDEEDVPSDVVCRIQCNAQQFAKGRPPTVFFLWSQRYDVYPIFRVGPIKYEYSASESSKEWGTLLNSGGMITGMVTGTATDPLKSLRRWIDGAFPEPEDTTTVQANELVDQPNRCETIEEWDAMHGALFDSIVGAAPGTKLTDDQKKLLRGTCPLGLDPNASIAIANRKAAARAALSPQLPLFPLLGVVAPPDAWNDPDQLSSHTPQETSESGATIMGQFNATPLTEMVVTEDGLFDSDGLLNSNSIWDNTYVSPPTEEEG